MRQEELFEFFDGGHLQKGALIGAFHGLGAVFDEELADVFDADVTGVEFPELAVGERRSQQSGSGRVDCHP